MSLSFDNLNDATTTRNPALITCKLQASASAGPSVVTLLLSLAARAWTQQTTQYLEAVRVATQYSVLEIGVKSQVNRVRFSAPTKRPRCFRDRDHFRIGSASPWRSPKMTS
jgi:hypothetical protein